ncbi:MAG: magnesium protoporphyrin IX methyltransferase [Hyphomonas sp.]
MMDTAYQSRRTELQTYFGDTAAATWEKLTSTAPVSGIRAAVRAGRDAMHETVLSWLPHDLTGRRVLDAGCGTGTFSVAAAGRGAEVLGIDIAGPLVEIAASRLTDPVHISRITWRVGDMTHTDLGVFDHAVAVDSIIHYEESDMAAMVSRILPRIRRSLILTHAPRTALLTAMHAAGKLFPRADRAPAIIPVSGNSLARRIEAASDGAFRVARRKQISSGFYFSEAMEIVRA